MARSTRKRARRTTSRRPPSIGPISTSSSTTPASAARSGFGAGTGDKVVDKATDDPQEIPWISDIFRILKKNPKIKNIYFELGSTFASAIGVESGKVLPHARADDADGGADHILWGTDSIWNGSPQSQIERLRRLKMPEKLMEKYKYADLTAEVKNGILGLNAAKVFAVDVKEARKAIKADKLTRLKEEYRKDPWPSNTQYGWIWTGEGQATVPVGT